MKEKLGNRIIELRTKQNLSIEQLAESINLKVKELNKIESNKTSPDIDVLLKLSTILNTSVDYLLKGEDIKSTNLDDMDSNKRLDYILKQDDDILFKKYGYLTSNNWKKIYTPPYLNKDFWYPIFNNNSYKIFKYVMDNISAEIEKYFNGHSHKYNGVNRSILILTELGYENLKKYVEFCLKEDNEKWLKIVNFKYIPVIDPDLNIEYNKNRRNLLRSRSHIVEDSIQPSILELFFESKKTAPSCYNYILTLDHENRIFNCMTDFYENEILKLLVKYDDKKNTIYFIKQMEERVKNQNNSITARYVSEDMPYISLGISHNHYQGTVVIRTTDIKEFVFDYAIDLKMSKYVDLFLHYNDNLKKYVKEIFQYDLNVYLPSNIQLEDKSIRSDKTLTNEQMCKKIIERDEIVSFEILEELWKESKTEKTYKYFEKVLKEKDITYYTIFKRLIDNKKWKKLYEYSIEFDCEQISQLYAQAYYDRASKDLLRLSVDSKNQKQTMLPNSPQMQYYKNSCKLRDEKDSNILEYIQSVIDDWLKAKKEDLETHILKEKMENFSKDITKDYVLDQIKNGSIELAIIKLCSVLESKLTVLYNREDELLNLLNEYCQSELHWSQDDGWGYYEEVSDEEQIRILNKLRITRNGIVHQQNDAEKLTFDELIKCVDYVFNVQKNKNNGR